MSRTNLAVIMDRLGISQGELQRRTGLARQTIADAYHGRGRQTPQTMASIAKELRVPLDSIDPLAAEHFDGLVIR
jgi:transcriptional regulator with XRE-family HTH domain